MPPRCPFHHLRNRIAISRESTILLAEDEPTLGELVAEHLRGEGFQVLQASDGEQALEVYLSHQPDLLVLDIMMPRLDGMELARKIRMENPVVPIIFLTARNQSKDVVEGFRAGANDYLRKPFSMEELTVRIQALLGRREEKHSGDILTVGRFRFNHIKQELRLEDAPIPLTHREAELLYYLVQNRNQLLDRSVILKKLWRDDDFFSARSMDVFISKLRKKLKADPEVQIINIRGQGYKLIC